MKQAPYFIAFWRIARKAQTHARQDSFLFRSLAAVFDPFLPLGKLVCSRMQDADGRDDIGQAMRDGRRPAPYEDISTAACIAIIVAASPFYFFFDYKSQAFRGLVAAMSALIVMGLPVMLRPLTKNPVFWATLVLIGVAHIALVYFLPYTGNFRYGFAFFPLFFADAYLWARLLIHVCGSRLQD